ncbi:LOW QUALITY PROTEIN: hypothetical protein V1477_006073 [Vespula maculifrons]|uniref:Uncharacterized protein n=1 Tax=Vespula maculifrons TaxID=7453 RepID=A0ABD2CKQ4_VESMC
MPGKCTPSFIESIIYWFYENFSCKSGFDNMICEDVARFIVSISGGVYPLSLKMNCIGSAKMFHGNRDF